jgi:hypothetical protein
VGGVCGTYRREEKVIHGFGEKTCRRDLLKDLGIDGAKNVF